MKEISVQELKEKMDAEEDIFILDVREEFEYHISNIGGTLIPLAQLADRLDELNKSDEIVAICRSGSRSAQACNILEKHGFSNVLNLKGGINRWAGEIDNTLPVY